VPLNPASWTAQRWLGHRDALRTANPRIRVTKVTCTGQLPSVGLLLQSRARPCQGPAERLRSTRLIDLVNNLDPKLVSATFAMTAEGVLTYFAASTPPTRPPSRTR
jgi:hypothetical protein